MLPKNKRLSKLLNSLKLQLKTELHLGKKPTLQQLTKTWYAKLAKEGFEDIEQDEEHLKRWDSLYFIVKHTNFKGAGSSRGKDAKFSPLSFESRQEYYQLAGAFLYDHPFETEKERTIWSFHAEGMNVKEIYDTLKNTKHKTYKDGIKKILGRLEEMMVTQCQPRKT